VFIKSCNGLIFLHFYGFKCMVHVFVIIVILKGLNLMILTTFTCVRKINQSNINISNEGLCNVTP
jgi:hypothetical protein